jgi:hypothetical protein
LQSFTWNIGDPRDVGGHMDKYVVGRRDGRRCWKEKERNEENYCILSLYQNRKNKHYLSLPWETLHIWTCVPSSIQKEDGDVHVGVSKVREMVPSRFIIKAKATALNTMEGREREDGLKSRNDESSIHVWVL